MRKNADLFAHGASEAKARIATRYDCAFICCELNCCTNTGTKRPDVPAG